MSFLRYLAVCTIILILVCPTWAASGLTAVGERHRLDAPHSTDLTAAIREHKVSKAFEWLDIALEATAREHDRSGARPTVGSRS